MSFKTTLNPLAILKLSGYIFYKQNHLIKWVGRNRFHANIKGEVIFIHQDCFRKKGYSHISYSNNEEVFFEIRRIKREHCI